MTPSPKPVSENTPIPGIHLGLVLALGASMLAGIGGVGAIFSHELSPVRDDIQEMKTDIRELRDRPNPQGILTQVESQARAVDALTRRIETLERE